MPGDRGYKPWPRTEQDKDGVSTVQRGLVGKGHSVDDQKTVELPVTNVEGGAEGACCVSGV